MFGRTCGACKQSKCDCVGQTTRMLADLSSSPCTIIESIIPAAQRRPADGYIEFGGGVVNVWEIDGD